MENNWKITYLDLAEARGLATITIMVEPMVSEFIKEQDTVGCPLEIAEWVVSACNGLETQLQWSHNTVTDAVTDATYVSAWCFLGILLEVHDEGYTVTVNVYSGSNAPEYYYTAQAIPSTALVQNIYAGEAALMHSVSFYATIHSMPWAVDQISINALSEASSIITSFEEEEEEKEANDVSGNIISPNDLPLPSFLITAPASPSPSPSHSNDISALSDILSTLGMGLIQTNETTYQSNFSEEEVVPTPLVNGTMYITDSFLERRNALSSEAADDLMLLHDCSFS